jgi:heme-degrading monooxygenase HmoA
MYAVIFQVEPKTGRDKEYLDIAATLRPELDKIDGFISVERFESVYNPGKYVSISFWRDEAAILAWRTHIGHQHAQRKGRGEVFADYRLSVVQVVRDYGMTDREEAPMLVVPSWGEDFPF